MGWAASFAGMMLLKRSASPSLSDLDLLLPKSDSAWGLAFKHTQHIMTSESKEDAQMHDQEQDVDESLYSRQVTLFGRSCSLSARQSDSS